jgi:hypothetical protein
MSAFKVKLGSLQMCGTEIYIIDPAAYVPFPGDVKDNEMTIPFDKVGEVLSIINSASESAYDDNDQEVSDALTRLYAKVIKMADSRGIKWSMVDYNDLMKAAAIDCSSQDESR